MKCLAAAIAVLCALSVEASARTRAVIMPIPAAGREPAEAKTTAAIEAALLEGVRKIPGVEIANLEGAKLRGPARDSKNESRPQARGQALAHELGAEVAVVAEPQPLGDGAVVYLQVVEATGRVRGSTTVALSSEALHTPADLERSLRGGVVQVMDPTHFVGRAELHVDVKGAEVEVDGRRAASAATGAAITLVLPVGTHAVRVTHPAYHDYLRFIDIAFDKTTTENVAMAMFPLTEGEMADKRRRTGPTRKVPWYRSWWALTITGAVLVGATAGIVYAAKPNISANEHVVYKARPAP
jgi:hypothetical protein